MSDDESPRRDGLQTLLLLLRGIGTAAGSLIGSRLEMLI